MLLIIAALVPQNPEFKTQGDLTSVIGKEGHLWFAAGKHGLFYSIDRGDTWNSVENINEAAVIGLGKEAPDSNYKTLYTNSKINNKWGIYKSIDMGKTWERINDDDHQFGAANSTITGDPRIYGRVYLGTNGRGIQYRDLD
jgi:xyloglucan-specific exo-beta-1,4-glucanase